MNLKEIKKDIWTKELILHVLLLILFFMSINVSWTENWFHNEGRVPILSPITAISLPFFFYLNSFILIPSLLSSKKWYQYFFVLIPSYILIDLIRVLGVLYFLPETRKFTEEIFNPESLIFGSPSVLFLSLFFSFAYRFTKDWIINRKTIVSLKAEKNAMELNLLKSQVNPHFLFNSLNVLDDLIERDKAAAKTYLHRLSNLYRYSLLNMENDVVPLQKEWKFIEDFVFLLEVRFGSVYQFQLNYQLTEKDRILIPPSALQSLIENAVKHNQGNTENPLRIKITASKEGILVSHEKRLKLNQDHSLGTGLKNLQNRYQLLTNQKVIIEDKNYFKVTLPLIRERA